MIKLYNNIDKVAFITYLVLVIFGILNIYSSSFDPDYPNIFSLNGSYGRQIMWGGISLIVGILIFLLEPDFIKKNAIVFYGVCLTLLFLVLIVGQERGGAKAWFGVGSFGIQPSEFMKIAVALMIANRLSDINVNVRKKETQLYLAAIIFIPIVLIMLQPDLGTVLVFSSFILVLYREGVVGNIILIGLLYIGVVTTALIFSDTTFNMFGIDVHSKWVIIGVLGILTGIIIYATTIFVYKRYRGKIMFRTALISAGAMLLVWGAVTGFKMIPENYQIRRIKITLGLLEDPKNDGYNITQALSAIGSGEFAGKGYKSATLANSTFNHVPEQSTDFIFCTLAEEWGFLGGLVLFSLLTFFIIRLIILAERQRSVFSRTYIYAVACILFLHFTINVGMVMGVAPVIGIPLPFFSYGGSSLLAFSIMIFIALKLDADRLDIFH